MLTLRIPPPIYMLLIAGMMWCLDRYFPVIEFTSLAWLQFGLVMIVLGMLIDGLSIIAFIRSRTSVNPLKPELTRHLVKTGLYRWTINPMYLGMLLLLSGWACVLGSVTPFITLPVFVAVLTVAQIVPEEIALAKKFGQAYLDYKATVWRWL